MINLSGFFNKKIIKSSCAILCAAAISLSAAGCASGNVSKLKSEAPLSVNAPQAADEALRTVPDNANLEKVAASGLIELYADKATLSPVVRETSKDKYWYALPTEAKGAGNTESVLSAAVLSGGKLFSLNSQDNALAFGKAVYAPWESGFSVTYTMASDSAKAALTKDTVKEGDLWLQVTVNYTLKDGCLFVNIDMAKTLSAPGMKILDISFLGSFGASSAAGERDYMLVPDGSGAVIKTGVPDPEYKTRNFSVYSEKEGSYKAIVPAFGIKQGESAFAAIIRRGAENADIKAQRAGADNSLYNKVGVTFNVTPYAVKDNTVYTGEKSEEGVFEIVYRFLLGNNAGYGGMAVATREQFIRDGVLSTKTVDEAEDLPLVLSLIGKGVKNKNPKSHFSYTKTLTSYEEALDIVTQLKSKGIDNIALRYKGALDGGLNQSDIFSAGRLQTLGTKKEFTELYDYVNGQNFTLFIETDVLSAGNHNRFSSGKSAENIYGDRLSYIRPNELSGIYGGEAFEKNVIATDKIEKATEELVKNFEDTAAGISLGDMGNILYNDFSGSFTSRRETADIIAESAQAIATGRKLMISGGNFYMVKNANFIADLPLKANAPENAAYVSVPFVQMILHGISDYSGTPINYADNSRTAFLKSVEYGAVPSFELVYREKKDGSDEKINYSRQMNDMAKFYEEANEALADLRDKRIKSHYGVADGVYCTEYSTGSMIYVNYTETDFTVNGVKVPSMDFVRIN